MFVFDEDDDNERERKKLIFLKENEENIRILRLSQSTLALIIVVWRNSYKTSIFAHKSHDAVYEQSFLHIIMN